MEKASDYHRDIYSGMVANELGKEGYFGDAVSAYGFMIFVNGNWELQYSFQEEECAKEWIAAMKKGQRITTIASVNYRIFQQEEYLQKVNKVKQQLSAQLLSKCEEFLCQPCNMTDSVYYQKLHAYIYGLSDEDLSEKKDAIEFLLGNMLHNGYLSFEEYQPVYHYVSTQKDTKNESGKAFYGFLYLKENAWCVYCNGYLPSTIEKWREYTVSLTCVSGIVSRMYPQNAGSVFEKKQKFIDDIKKIFDNKLLELHQF